MYCKYCTADVRARQHVLKEIDIEAKIEYHSLLKTYINIEHQDYEDLDDRKNTYIEINYCPICGKNLSEVE